MANVIEVTNVRLLNNPCKFNDSFGFEISFNADRALEQDIEWRVSYVGSADSDDQDQVLESVMVGPIVEGKCQFELYTKAPDASRIAHKDLLGVTCVMLDGYYCEKNFTRVGYYLCNELSPDFLAKQAAAAEGATASASGGASSALPKSGEAEAMEIDADDIGSESDRSESEDEGEEDVRMEEEEEPRGARAAPAVKAEDHLEQQQAKQLRFTTDDIIRSIVDEPRVTRFAISWDVPAAPGQPQPAEAGLEDAYLNNNNSSLGRAGIHA